MGMYKEDITLCIDEANNLLRNAAPRDESEGLPLIKLSNILPNTTTPNLTNITVLEISNCDISTIPPNIKNLNLRQLILSHNKLKEVPSCLYTGLRSLELLDLSHNFLRDFQVEPACSAEVQKLNLSYNEIYDFPQWIVKVRCPKLHEVDYSGNFIVQLNTATQFGVKKLIMLNCQMMDVDFTFLKKAKDLEYLDISNDASNLRDNQFKDIRMLFFKPKWKNLKVLKLNNLLLSIIPKELFSVETLAELHLIRCELNWIPDEIEYLQNLAILDVSHNSICALPIKLTQLKSLSVVKAQFNYISGIGRFSGNLEILDLYENRLESFPENIKNFRYIDLEKNLFSTAELEDFGSYRSAKDEYRATFDLSRVDGRIELDEQEMPETERESSCEDASEHSQQYYDDLADDECWDDEKPPLCSEKHPDVTSSDDEWDGEEEHLKKKLKEPSSCFDTNEDWIFIDAEEA